MFEKGNFVLNELLKSFSLLIKRRADQLEFYCHIGLFILILPDCPQKFINLFF
jgi:hypothetical protein